MPPVSPGLVVTETVDELRSLLTSCTGGSVRAHLPAGAHWNLGGQPLSVSQCAATIDGGGKVATLDGGGMSRLFNVAGGASLKLKRVNLINGVEIQGGGVRVEPGGSLEVEQSTVGNMKARAYTKVTDLDTKLLTPIATHSYLLTIRRWVGVGGSFLPVLLP